MEEKETCIVVVSLNPCVDKTVWIDRFICGGTNRIQRAREDVSGKGTNVCTAFWSLNQPCICVGFDYRDSKKTVAQELGEKGIPCRMVTLPGAMRTNLKIFESSTGVMSEVNEYGNTIPGEALKELLRQYRGVLETLSERSMVILSGSVPPGVPSDIYRRMVEIAREYGVRALLDASGEPLLLGAEAVPFAMKPNQDEIGQLLGSTAGTLEEAALGAKEMIRRGVRFCCVSLGEKGAVLATPEHVYLSPAVEVEVRGIQGAGDSLVAGITLALMNGKSDREALQYAMAAAGGSVMRDGSLMCTRQDFERLLDKVIITEMD